MSRRENGARGIIFPSSVYRMAVLAKGGWLNFLILDWVKPTLAAIARLFGGVIIVGLLNLFLKKYRLSPFPVPISRRPHFPPHFPPTKSVGQLSKIGRLAKEKGKKVTCETLWIHSKSDVVADFQVSREVFETIPAKKKYFIEYYKSNHVILYDYDHMHAIDKITSFLKGDFNGQSIENN